MLPTLLGVAAELSHFGLECTTHLRTLAGVLLELRLYLGARQTLRRGLEAVLAVLAGFDQVVEHRNRFVVLHLQRSSFSYYRFHSKDGSGGRGASG
jgi:hypothetical protein